MSNYTSKKAHNGLKYQKALNVIRKMDDNARIQRSLIRFLLFVILALCGVIIALTLN